MRYLGGKQRLGKTIAGYINTLGELHGAQTCCEPFCGMCGVGRHVTIPERRFSDIHPDLILFLQAIRDGWVPPENISEEEYK